MQFFFSGGGDFEFFASLDREFAQALGSNASIHLIPYASDPGDFEEIYARVLDTYGGPKKVTVNYCKDPSQIDNATLGSASAVYIEGGNTFDLITTLREHNIETYLKSFAKQQNRILFADSAGAIIAGRSVRTAFLGDDADDDEKRLQDYRGLDLLDSWTIHAHYAPEDDDAVMNFVYDEGTPVLALYEETGVYLSENFDLKVLTPKPAEVFTHAGKETFSSGKVRSLSEFF